MSTNVAVQVYAPEAGTKTGTSAVSTAAVDVGLGTARVILTPDQDVHIRFGNSAVGAAVATDVMIWAKTTAIFDIKNANHYFRVIRDSADGNLYWAAVQ